MQHMRANEQQAREGEPIAFHVHTHRSHDNPPTDFIFQLVLC